MDNVQALYQNVAAGHPAAYLVRVGVVRSKITEKANDALTNVDIDCLHICASLVGDRQQLQTLQKKIPFLKNEKKNFEEFCREVTEL